MSRHLFAGLMPSRIFEVETGGEQEDETATELKRLVHLLRFAESVSD